MTWCYYLPVKLDLADSLNAVMITMLSHTISYYKLEGHFFSNRPSDRAQILQACADRDENGSHLKKSDPPHPNLIQNPFVLKAVRQTAAVRRSSDRRCGQISYAHASLRFARFASLLGEMLLYQHQRIVTTTKVYIASNNLPVEIIQ